MAIVHEGSLHAGGRRIAIVAGRFNDSITTRLVNSALDCVARHGGDPSSVHVYWVPGSFEIPQMTLRIAQTGQVDGIVCLGAIIRGETNHFDNLCSTVIRAIEDISLRCALPITYGVVTADTFEQAMNRAGGKNGNKGWESTLALIEMMGLWEGERERG